MKYLLNQQVEPLVSPFSLFIRSVKPQAIALILWLNIYFMQVETSSSVEIRETSLLSHNHSPVVEHASVEGEVEFQILIK